MFEPYERVSGHERICSIDGGRIDLEDGSDVVAERDGDELEDGRFGRPATSQFPTHRIPRRI